MLDNFFYIKQILQIDSLIFYTKPLYNGQSNQFSNLKPTVSKKQAFQNLFQRYISFEKFYYKSLVFLIKQTKINRNKWFKLGKVQVYIWKVQSHMESIATCHQLIICLCCIVTFPYNKFLNFV